MDLFHSQKAYPGSADIRIELALFRLHRAIVLALCRHWGNRSIAGEVLLSTFTVLCAFKGFDDDSQTYRIEYDTEVGAGGRC